MPDHRHRHAEQVDALRVDAVGQGDQHRHGHGVGQVEQPGDPAGVGVADRSEEHTSELQSLMRISYAVFCLKKKKQQSRSKTTSISYIQTQQKDLILNNTTKIKYTHV